MRRKVFKEELKKYKKLRKIILEFIKFIWSKIGLIIDYQSVNVQIK